MEKKKIIESNRLIAEFMKIPYIYHEEKIILNREYTRKELFTEGELQFHESWNDLMPVLAKIKSLNYNVEINHGQHNECVIYGEGLQLENVISVGSPDLELINSTWKAVVEFIQWYNQQK